MSNHETTERIVLCADRDYTVSVNPHPDHRAVPVGWLQFWSHVEEVPVWASGNQHLRVEAEIPGLQEAEYVWSEYLGNGEYYYENSQFEDYIKPRRRDSLRLIQDLYEKTFPDQKFRFVVVDDADVNDLSTEGPWTWYAPWDFRAAIEDGALEDSFGLMKPPEDSYTNEGVPFNSTHNPDFEIQEQTVTEIKNELWQ